MSTQDDLGVTTDYYQYHDPSRMVEYDIPVRPSNDLFNTIALEDGSGVD